MVIRAVFTSVLFIASATPAAAGQDEPLQHVEGLLYQVNRQGEITNTKLGTFRLDSAGTGGGEDLREAPGTAELRVPTPASR